MHKLIVPSSVAALVMFVTYSSHLMVGESVRTRARIIVTLIWLCMIMFWPVIWRIIVAKHVRSIHPIIGLIWPVGVLSLDLLSMRQNTYENQRQPKRPYMTMDANAMCGLTFGIAGFLGVNRDREISKIFLSAIVACIAFIMPTPYTDGTSLYTVGVDAFQKGVLAYATGLLISGVVLVHNAPVSTAAPTVIA